MAAENPLWGEERIANELLVKLGILVSPRTVGKVHAEATARPAAWRSGGYREGPGLAGPDQDRDGGASEVLALKFVILRSAAG